MSLIAEITSTLLPGKITGIQVGFTRTAVLAETPKGLSCGLAATFSSPGFDHRSRPSVQGAGHLLELSTAEILSLTSSPSQTEVSIALAAINALLPMDFQNEIEINAEEYLRRNASDKNIAMVGHFVFVESLRPDVKNLWVLELNPQPGDFDASQAPEIIPQADLVVITATTLINSTFEELMTLRKPETKVMLLGPSTPLSPILFDHGIDILSGTIVTDPRAVMLGISQGASSHQLKQEGYLRRVTLQKT